MPVLKVAVPMMATLGLIVQTAVPVPDATLIGQIERLGLVGVLIFAVIVLWRKLERQDGLELQAHQELVKAFTTNSEVMREMKDQMRELTQVVEKLIIIRESLAETQANPVTRLPRH